MPRIPSLRVLLHRKGPPQDKLRVALQTAVAAAATYAVINAVGLEEHLSWAVIASLFAISISADSSVFQGFGRIVGAFLGVGLGIGVSFLGAHVVVSLALSTAAANAIATIWPNLRYTAVTAAIVALDPTPEPLGATVRASAILLGTLIGVGVTFLLWPRFGREQAAATIRTALADCETLLRAIIEGIENDERVDRNAVHARFLGRLETLHDQISTTYFAPRLPSGASLREAAVSLEHLWHGLVILDRAISDKRSVLINGELPLLRPIIYRAQCAALEAIGDLREGVFDESAPPPSTENFRRVIGEARRSVRTRCVNESQALGFHSVQFALDELEARIVQLVRVLKPTEGRSEEIEHSGSEVP